MQAQRQATASRPGIDHQAERLMALLNTQPTEKQLTNLTMNLLLNYNSIKYESKCGLKKQVKIFFLVEVLKCTAKEVEKIYFLAVQYDYWHQCKTQNYGVY